MANPYATNMNNPSDGSTGAPSDKEEYENVKFNKVGDEYKGVITGQSRWMDGSNGTFRIINLKNNDRKVSVIVGSDGQKEAVSNALEDAELTDTAVGDLFKLTWTEERPTKSGRKFRVFEAKVARPVS